MAYEAGLTEAARAFHGGMFPGYESDFLRTLNALAALDEVYGTGEAADEK